MTIQTLRVVAILQQTTGYYLIVSDGNENIREGKKEIESFRKNAESFITENYSEHLTVTSSSVDFQSENHQGCAWVAVIPRTEGIIEDISRHYGLEIVK